MRLFFKTLWREDAATAVEYAVMLALILIAVIGAIGSVGAGTGGMWGTSTADFRPPALDRNTLTIRSDKTLGFGRGFFIGGCGIRSAECGLSSQNVDSLRQRSR